MNSPFVLEQARSLAVRAELKAESPPSERIEALYRVALQRLPEPSEIRLAESFLAAQKAEGAKLTPLEKLAQVLLLSNEALFVD